MEKTNVSEDEAFLDSEIQNDLPEILARGKLTVLFENSSSSYFMYKGRKMGFEYELLKLFADDLGVDLEVKIVHNLDSLITDLNSGKGDFIACNYTVTKDRNKVISFTEPFMNAHQVLIQRKPEGWKDMKEKDWKAQLLNSPSDLVHKKVHVWKNSSYYQRLEHLQDEIGDTIFIEASSGSLGGEELIEMVSEGIIDHTIIEDNVAKINLQFFDNLDASLRLSVDQKMAFGLRRSSRLLKARFDEWLNKFKDGSTYRYIHRKYFVRKHIGAKKSTKKYTTLDGKNISQFDAFFKKAGSQITWDWRLIASICYQESKFNPNITSFGGAYGMMQFMPNTGPTYGVYPDSPPEVQIMGGAKKLKADEKFWKNVPDAMQRKKFSMASYNSGRGHILDAQRLAKKHGLDPYVWDDNVETMLLNLSKKEYYQDEVVRHGRIRSKITYNYVRDVMARYIDWAAQYPI